VTVDLHRVPGHVAIVGDGADEASLLDVVGAALDVGLRWLTVEVVAAASLGEPVASTCEALAAAEPMVVAIGRYAHDRGVRIRVLGRREPRIPCRLQRVLSDAEALTAGNHGLTLTLAVDHDGRVELADAIAALAEEVRAGKLRPAAIDEDTVAAHLTVPDLPDPDLIVRTGGDTRTAGVLVWQSAYSELVFTEAGWPRFGRADLLDAVEEYQQRERRFGAVSRASRS
jgi:undecaprenyl diphosphate synthase